MCHTKPGLSHGAHAGMCQCTCSADSKYLSKKGKIKMLKSLLQDLEDKAEDIREYITELSKDKN